MTGKVAKGKAAKAAKAGKPKTEEVEDGKIRRFALRNEAGEEVGVFTGASPRQAALKAANRSEGTKEKPVVLMLRERGTKKVHVYNGWKQKVPITESAKKLGWLKGDTMNKAFVKKVRIDTVEKK